MSNFREYNRGENPGKEKFLTANGITLAPVPILAEDYMKGFENIGTLPGPERVSILHQNQRMLEAFERFKAWLHPVGRWGERDQGVLWQVKFPGGSKWVDGEPSKGALAAVHNAYALNKQFPGFMNHTPGDPKAPLSVDKILDKALQGKRAEQADSEGEAKDRAKTILGLDGAPLKILPPSSPKEP